MARLPRPIRPVRWIVSSRRDFGDFPENVQRAFGFGLFLAQTGQHPPNAKPLKGLGSGLVELVDDHDGDTYRAVYTVRLEAAIYVLHAFKKKSKRGIKTSKGVSTSSAVVSVTRWLITRHGTTRRATDDPKPHRGP